MKSYLSIDVEDWFQVDNFKDFIYNNEWSRMEYRLEKNIESILNILNKKNTKATFFVLGWVAERDPKLVMRIFDEGHEIACHGYSHTNSLILKYRELKDDISKSKKILEDIIQKKVIGFRAPSFSITSQLLDILVELKFEYDSSLFSSDLNSKYGKIQDIGVPRKDFKINKDLFEFPLSTNSKLGLNIPWSGGFMFRALPYFIFEKGMNKILKKNNYYLFYIHPWEFDISQPKVHKARMNQKLKHYYNIKTTMMKFERLIHSRNFCPINSYFQT